MRIISVFSSIMVAFLVTACGSGGDPEAPAGGNSGNTVTEEEVGKLIFEDTRLSANNNQSCASCHSLVATDGFADPDSNMTAPVSEGSIANQFGDRNAPTAAYAQFIPVFSQITDPVRGQIYAGGQFLDGRRDTLEEQAKDPFLNAVEMANADKLAVVSKVQNGPYADDFMQVYGNDVFNNTDIAYDRIAEAIATFERSPAMNQFNSKFDCYLQDSSLYPLSVQEQAGLDIFDDPDQGKCSSCHLITPDPISGEVLLTNFQYFNIGVPSNPDNPANVANMSFVDLGLGGRLVPAEAAEDGKFRTPTLRNVELTAPYMHNGVHATLDEVVQHYDIDVANEFITPEVNRNIATELGAGTFTGLGLNAPDDYNALVAFMRTLTDGSGVGICF